MMVSSLNDLKGGKGCIKSHMFCRQAFMVEDSNPTIPEEDLSSSLLWCSCQGFIKLI